MAEIRHWAHLTSDELASVAGERSVAVLPVGAMEQHGPHLPLGTDTMIADGLVWHACERLDSGPTVLLLPTQAIGESTEHGAFPGTLSHEAETLLAAWTELGVALSKSGIHKLIIVNAHGGQPQIVDLVAQRLRSRHAMLVVRANYMNWPLPDGLLDDDERRHGHHGGQAETSMMLAFHPDLVKMDRAADFPSNARNLAASHQQFGHGGSLGFAWQAEDLNPQGVVGNAVAASPELGRALLDHHAGRLANMIADASAFDRQAHFRKGD